MPAPAGAFSVFPHYCSSVCSRRSLLCISPCRSSVRSRRSLIRISPRPQQWLLPQERYLYFLTTAVVTAPLGSTICISPLPQQCLLPQERYLYFLTAAAVLAPAGAFSPPGPSPSPPPPSLSQQPHDTQEPPPAVFFTTAVVPALAGTFSIFPHYRSSACSSRNLLYISPRPQQWLLPQEHLLFFPHYRSSVRSRRSSLYFSTAAAVPAPAGALPIFHCRSSDCSRRSATCISSLPQQRMLPSGALPVFPHCPSSVCSRRSATYISSLPQQRSLQQEPLPPAPPPLGPGQMLSSDPSPRARGVPRARELLPSSEPSPRTACQIRIPFIQFIIK